MTTKARRAYMPVWDVKLASCLTKIGWSITGLASETHNVLVLGDGPPISPFLYGQRRIPTLRVDMPRDLKEWKVLREYARTHSTLFPKIGFGRGAHLLNVFNGGSSWQSSNGHKGPTVHRVINYVDGSIVWTTTNHEQLMRTTLEADILAVAVHESLEYTDDSGTVKAKDMKLKELDIEACYYASNNALCFQPSDLTHQPTMDLFVALMEDSLRE